MTLGATGRGLECQRGPEKERETLRGRVEGWRANGKEQGDDDSMQQTLIKHLMGAEEQGARKATQSL